jgi:multiple sugar transport system substrate-binding protein
MLWLMSKHSARRFGTFFAAGLGLLLAAACSNGTPATIRLAPTPTPPAGPPVTISWSYWGDPQEKSIDERIITLFEQEHPEINVVGRWAPYESYISSWQQWNKQGDPADVAFLYDVPAYAPAGDIADLAPFIAGTRYDTSDFYPALLDDFRWNSSLYGLPRDNDTKVFFYNKDLFDAAHLPYPQAGWTWQQMLHDAQVLTATDASPARYGLAFEPQNWWKVWVWQNGGAIFDDPAKPTHLLLDSPAATQAISFMRDLIYTDKVTPPYDKMKSSDTIGPMFAAGQLGLAFGNHALVPLFAAQAGLHWGVVGLPAQVTAANYAGGAGYVISSHSRQPQAAWTFLTWLLSPKGEALFTESGLIVPSRRSVGNSNVFLHQGLTTAVRAEAQAGSNVVPTGPIEAGTTFLSETEHGKPFVAFPGSDTITALIESALQPVWASGADPGPILQALTPQVDAALAHRAQTP